MNISEALWEGARRLLWQFNSVLRLIDISIRQGYYVLCISVDFIVGKCTYTRRLLLIPRREAEGGYKNALRLSVR